VVVLITVLLVAGGYFFLVAQASAGVPSPAALLVVASPVEVGRNDGGYAAATSGQSLDVGSSVRTGVTGRAAIQFPDGSLMRLSPSTTVTIRSAQLTIGGNLKSANILQKIGRTLTTVQHLTGGASFQVEGHAVTAEVRGTQFELLVRSDGSNTIKLFSGVLKVGGQTTVNLTAGQEIDVDPDGRLSAVRPIVADLQDPYPLEDQCGKGAASGGDPGTAQTDVGEGLRSAQSASASYYSTGGDVTVALCYPGSLMRLTVTDPGGGIHAAQGPPPVIIKIPSGSPGQYIATVRALNVATPGEPFAVRFATSTGCAAANVDTGGVVRETFSPDQLAQLLSQSGVTGITIQVQGASDSSARIYYHSTIGGSEVTWTIDFYAATPNLGWVLTQVTSDPPIVEW
jgi:hypothetical protein